MYTRTAPVLHTQAHTFRVHGVRRVAVDVGLVENHNHPRGHLAIHFGEIVNEPIHLG